MEKILKNNFFWIALVAIAAYWAYSKGYFSSTPKEITEEGKPVEVVPFEGQESDNTFNDFDK